MAAADWIKEGGRVLALGLNQTEANSFLPAPVTMRTAEHIAAWFPAFNSDSPLAGVAPADVHNRDPRALPLVSGGATVYGDGVLAVAGNVVFCQLPPFQVSKSMGALSSGQFNQRRTFQRTSFAVSRIMANLGVSASTPLLHRFGEPVGASNGPSLVRNGDFSAEAIQEPTVGRWLDGLYLTKPTEWDDPYRFFGW